MFSVEMLLGEGWILLDGGGDADDFFADFVLFGVTGWAGAGWLDSGYALTDFSNKIALVAKYQV